MLPGKASPASDEELDRAADKNTIEDAAKTPAPPRWLTMASTVLFVTDLGRSLAFYAELLGWQVTLQEDTVALLVSPEGTQLYLHSRGPNAQHARGQVGVQYIMWTAADETDLGRCEQVLRRYSTHVSRSMAEGFALVEGLGPDHLPILVTFPGPDRVPRSHIMRRVYEW